MTTPSATSMFLSENPGISGASPISRTTLVIALHPARILRRPPRRQSSVQAWRHREASLILRPGYLPAEVTRQTVFPTSSAIRSAPVLSTASPTGRPRALPSASRKSVTTSSALPLGRPPMKGTKTTL